jgi:hypothetical protein
MTHFLWHLEVRRVIFYPTMKFALLFLAEGHTLHVLWVVRPHLWMVNHPFNERMNNRGNVSLLEQRKTVTQFQVLGLGNSLELVNIIC